jgi:predicted ribosome quality control (RQC) complex YloA/Tae2 family protein
LKYLKKYNLINEIKMSKIVKRNYYNNYEILVGKNAKMNDILTFEISKPEDIWLHVSGSPGSHVIISVKDKEIPPKDVIEYASELAVVNSKSNGKSKVVWTKRKNVSKPKNSNIGEVNVDYKKSKFITIYKK